MDGPAADYPGRFEEMIDYLMGQLSDDPDDDEIEGVRQNAFREVEELDEEEVPLEATKALILEAVPHVLHIKARQRVDAMEFALEKFEEIKLLARVASRRPV